MTDKELDAAAYRGEMPQATMLKDDIIVTVRKLTTRISVSEQLKAAYRKANDINIMLEKRLQPMSDIDSMSREQLRDTLMELKRMVEGE